MTNQVAVSGQQKSKTSGDEDQRKVAAVYGLAKMCGGDIDRNALKLWLSVLQPYSADQVDAGFRAYIETEESSRMPMPAKVLRKIREACGIPSPVEMERQRELEAEAAWFNVRDKVSRVGSYGSPRFDSTTDRVIRAMGGWQAVCSWETASMAFKEKDFIRHWLAYAETGSAVELGVEGVRQELEDRRTEAVHDALPDWWLRGLARIQDA